MVRKKLKKPPIKEPTHALDLQDIVLRALASLDLTTLGDLDDDGLPMDPPGSVIKVFGVLKDISRTSFSTLNEIGIEVGEAVTGPYWQVKVLQAYKVKVKKAGEGVVCSGPLVLDLQNICLVMLLLCMQPETSSLRKAAFAILNAAQAADGMGRMDEVIERVVRSYLKHAGDDATTALSLSQANNKAGVDATPTRRWVGPLRWLVEGQGKHVIVAKGDEGLFPMCVKVLGDLLEVQSFPLREICCHEVPGDIERVEEPKAADRPVQDGNPRTPVKPADSSELAKSAECCREILKATACLFSLCPDWDAKASGSGAQVTSMCKLCLQVLSNPVVHRDDCTHASSALVLLLRASWKAEGLWQGHSVARGEVDGEDKNRYDGEGSCKGTIDVTVPSPAEIITANIFHGTRTRNDVDAASNSNTSCLLRSFLPLPPISVLALCRGLVNGLEPQVLLASYSSCYVVGLGGGGKETSSSEAGDLEVKTNLLCGPIVNSILDSCQESSPLAERVYAFMVGCRLLDA
ncbi:unnamed protein product [Choristocarpus tenellus]